MLGAIVSLLAAGYSWMRLDRGWVPHDEGTIAQSAERVLQGQVPHHDFIDVYSGGLSYLHAQAMQLFGVNLVAPRYAVFGLLLLWLPALYYCFTRLASPLAAAGLTLLAVAWSFPAYPAALPSWYILFFSTMGLAAMLRYAEDPRYRWLVLAGIAGGLAILAKVSGLFYVCAILAFLASRGVLGGARTQGTRTGNRLLAGFLAAGMLALVAAVLMLVRAGLTEGKLFHFVLPVAALGIVTVLAALRSVAPPLAQYLRGLVATSGLFLLGVFLPLALFALPYALRGQLGELLYGVLVLPSRRVNFAAMVPPGVRTALAALPLAALVLPWRPVGTARRWINLGIVALALLALLVLSRDSSFAYAMVWLSVRSLGTIVVLAGAFVLARGPSGWLVAPVDRERAALLLWMVALMSLLQFPFAAPVYYCYIAPLVLLALVGIKPGHERTPAGLPVLVGTFYFLFAVLLVHPGTVYSFGASFEPDRQTALLRMPRGGLRVTPEDQQVYERVTALVEQHASHNVVLATPDAPEVAFLAGRANPTRSLFEFFDAPLQEAELMSLLDQRGVTAVVINLKPSFSAPLSPGISAALQRRFPSGEKVGQFVVLW